MATIDANFLANALRGFCDGDDSLVQVRRDSELNAADGQPIVWLAKIFGITLPERVADSDLLWSLARRAEARRYRLFFLGGAEPVMGRAVGALKERFPDLQIAGTHPMSTDLFASAYR